MKKVDAVHLSITYEFIFSNDMERLIAKVEEDFSQKNIRWLF